MTTKTKADAEYRTELELKELATNGENWVVKQYAQQTGEEQPEIDVGYRVRIQAVHPVISILYPEARTAQLIDITDENVCLDLMSGMLLFCCRDSTLG
jgi:hypothetical protein